MYTLTTACRDRVNDSVGIIAVLVTLFLGSAGDAVATESRGAVPTLHVGDGTLDGSFLQPYANVWRVTVHYNDGRTEERGLSTDHVLFRDIGGQRTMLRTEGTTSVIGKAGALASASFSMTFNAFDPATMAPLSGEATNSDGVHESYKFERLSVTRTIQTSGKSATTKSIALSEPVVDFYGGMTGLLLAALPLKTGYSAVFPSLVDDAVEGVPIHVLREETVAAGYRGKVKAFVVAIGAEPSTSTYWISKQVPYVIRAEVRATNATASWDIVD